MGTYTDFHYLLILKNIPSEMANMIDYLVGRTEEKPNPLPDHELFCCPRWDRMIWGATVWRNTREYPWGYTMSNIVVISGHSKFKNYSREIEKFIEWLKPYIVGGGAYSHDETSVYSDQVTYHHGLDEEEQWSEYRENEEEK